MVGLEAHGEAMRQAAVLLVEPVHKQDKSVHPVNLAVETVAVVVGVRTAHQPVPIATVGMVAHQAGAEVAWEPVLVMLTPKKLATVQGVRCEYGPGNS